MSTDTSNLKIKYPTSKYPPDPDCKYCHGVGERVIHFERNEFTNEHDAVSPCICIFVEHKFARKIAPEMGKWAGKIRKEIQEEISESEE